MTDSLNVLLDRDFPPDYRREATELVAAELGVTVANTESAVIFRLRTEWLALSTLIVQGIAPAGRIHTLPHRQSGALLGLTQLQGELLICVSLATLLGVSTPVAPENIDGTSDGDRFMILKGNGGPLAIVVQEVQGVHRYRPEDLHDVPATLAHAGTRYTIGMLPWNDRLVARLDDELLLHSLSKVLS